MKKIIIFALILTLLPCSMFSLTSCDETIFHRSIVGEIQYVKVDGEDCTVYIRPLGQPENALWFTAYITDETDIPSGNKKYDKDTIPELALGGIVEIVYNSKESGPAYDAIAIKPSYETDKTITQECVELEFKRRYDDKYDMAQLGPTAWGEVVHVAKVYDPEPAYIIYMDNNIYDNNGYTLQLYWLSEEDLYMRFPESNPAYDDIRNAIESCESGYIARIKTYDYSPIKGMTVPAVMMIEIVDHNL